MRNFFNLLQLSTPSLGITCQRATRRPCSVYRGPFNSLSRDHRSGLMAAASTVLAFQLPLSGSRDHKRGRARWRVRHLSFQLPLSGSPGMVGRRLRHHIRYPFNSLSRDHDFILSLSWRYKHAYFQLPLSGSPSPIPGFSGSPRRSAAAPLRTNDS